MTERGAAFVAELAALPSEPARLLCGLPQLEALYRDLVRAAAPPNPQFERERIIVQAGNVRELVFLFGLLSEGENEAALILELAAGVIAADPSASVAHLIDEAWYYLRTSIDPQWQLDDGDPSASAALAYLFAVLCERLGRLATSAPAVALAAQDEGGRTAFLRSLRDALTPAGAASSRPSS